MEEIIFPKKFPRIESERLILREITDEDTQAIFNNFSDPEVAKWFFEQPLTEIDQAKEFIKAFNDEFMSGEGLTWAIALKGDDKCVGTCGYGDIEIGERGEIGFDLAQEQWGKGLMSEALVPIIAYGFDELGLKKVEAHSYSSNVRAINLLEKIGFQLDKISEDNHYYSISQSGSNQPAA
jgi:ribosomal-protein-alanine N-acetyltransferase